MEEEEEEESGGGARRAAVAPPPSPPSLFPRCPSLPPPREESHHPLRHQLWLRPSTKRRPRSASPGVGAPTAIVLRKTRPSSAAVSSGCRRAATPGLRTGARARPSCSASRLVSSESSLAASRAEARGAGQRADGFQLLRFFFF